MDFSKIKPYIAPRYWFSALGIVLVLLGLTGGTSVAGVDLTIEDPVMGYISIALGVVCLIGGLRLYRKVMRHGNPNK
jgi:hypothetical protein